MSPGIMPSGILSPGIMSSRITSFPLIAGLAIAALALPVTTHSAVAQDQGYRARDGSAADRWREFNGVYDYAGPGGIYGPGPGFAGSYIYVPGHGILGAPCGLPTSACPNSDRPAD